MLDRFISFFKSASDLLPGTDALGTIQSIDKNIAIKGHNVWILVTAAMLASIGLYTNSAAVIIGAMLISPLMSPILGVGLSVGINDREMLLHSLENLALAVGAALAASTLFFLIMPTLDVPPPEIANRTRPTLLDVAIGFFGGVAGIVAGSREEKTNAIPGVAIATALMPPLCVTGYGLASGKWDIFLGAFYLFFLNAVFISLSTYLIVRLLKFPYVDFIDMATKQKVARYMTFFVVLLIIPSIYLLYTVFKTQRTQSKVGIFLTEQVNDNFHRVIDHELVWQNEWLMMNKGDTLRVVVAGPYMDSTRIQQLNDTLPAYGLSGWILDPKQLSNPSLKVEEITAQVTGVARDEMIKLIDVKKAEMSQKDLQIAALQSAIDSIQADSIPYNQLQSELKQLYPDLTYLSFSICIEDDFKGNRDTIPLCVVGWDKRKVGRYERQKRQKQLSGFLSSRLRTEKVKVMAL
ncbi:MAG: DUF389 domain-containing protein [Bacteroidota bacterium]